MDRWWLWLVTAKQATVVIEMALRSFCPTCQRTVYVEEGTTPICPVCSSPLLETVDAVDTPEDAEKKA